MNIADYILIILVLFALISSIRYIFKKKRSGKCIGCSGNCSSCNSNNKIK